MKRINLKKYYYPLYETDTFIDLPDEIADAIEEEHRMEHNSERRLQGHTYSFDCSPGLEYHFLEQAPPPRTLFWQKNSGEKRRNRMISCCGGCKKRLRP